MFSWLALGGARLPKDLNGCTKEVDVSKIPDLRGRCARRLVRRSTVCCSSVVIELVKSEPGPGRFVALRSPGGWSAPVPSGYVMIGPMCAPPA